MPALERLSFDSEIFGVDFFRVATTDAGQVAALVARLQVPAIVDAKVSADDKGRIAELDALGFRKVSTLVEFSSSATAGNLDGDARDHLTLDADDLDEHARGFQFQRFAQDGRIPRERTVEFMRAWIANSLAGRREVVAIGRNFCTYAVQGQRLTIDLLSVVDGGKGIAGRLLKSIRAIAGLRYCAEVRVATEAENIRALRVYIGAGFVPVAGWAAMHLVLGYVRA